MTYWRSCRITLASLAMATSAVALSGPGAVAAGYPSKPITMIVPYQAGGSTETMARLLAQAMGAALGGTVVVQTKPGGGGAVGATHVAQAPGDGYTIMFTTISSLTYDPMVNKQIKYTTDSFKYVANVTEYQMAFVALPGKPYKTLKDLIAYSKTHPGLNAADQSGMSRAFINYIAKQEGVKWTAIPTRGGGEMVPFLLGGKIDFAWSGGVHQKYGDKMIVLASMLSHRLAASPDVPSVQELYGISMPGGAVVAVPKSTPDDIVAKLEAAVKKAMDDPGVTKVLDNLKFPKQFVGTSEMRKVVADTVAGLKKVVAAAN
ncbi:MAG: tripartite tricarboxylate transporter substrate binding protein [Hyphomicrobiaceae bacterium]